MRLTLDGGDMSQFKVLVVDDAPLMRMTIVNILKGDPQPEGRWQGEERR